MSDPYHGLTRTEYLCQLAEEYEVSKSLVFTLAHMLGPDEDFDGLITELEDNSDMMED